MTRFVQLFVLMSCMLCLLAKSKSDGLKPDYSFSYGGLISGASSWKVVAAYSQDNLAFYQSASCLTLTFDYLYKDPSKYQSKSDSGESSDFYDTSSSSSSSSSGSDDGSQYAGLQQNMTWLDLETATYYSNITTLDFGHYSRQTSNEAIFDPAGLTGTDNEWVVTMDNGYYIVYAKRDATEVLLLVNNIDDLEGSSSEVSDDQYYNHQGFSVFNHTLLDNVNVVYRSTYVKSCEISGKPLTNFSLDTFMATPWYYQAVYFPLQYSQPAVKQVCGEMAINNVSVVNNLTIVQFNISAFTQKGSQTIWETQQVNYFQDPIVASVFRPYEESDVSEAIVFYYEDLDQGRMYWAYGDRSWGWFMTNSTELLGSDAIEIGSEIGNEVGPNVPHQVFRSGSCNYGQE